MLLDLLPPLPFGAAVDAPVRELRANIAPLLRLSVGLVIFSSRILWLTTWKMIGFVLNGFVFVLIGLELRKILAGLEGRSPAELLAAMLLISGIIIVARFAWVYATSLLPNSPRQLVARQDPQLAERLTFVVAWSGLRGAVSLAAVLALPIGFPERNLILLITFVVILVTLVGQG